MPFQFNFADLQCRQCRGPNGKDRIMILPMVIVCSKECAATLRNHPMLDLYKRERSANLEALFRRDEINEYFVEKFSLLAKHAKARYTETQMQRKKWDLEENTAMLKFEVNQMESDQQRLRRKLFAKFRNMACQVNPCPHCKREMVQSPKLE